MMRRKSITQTENNQHI